jgi:hypothetical protein
MSNPFTYITTQADLYDFLQNNVAKGWNKGIMINDISIDVTTWVVPTNAFTKILEGGGKTITFVAGATNKTNWTGLFTMTGGRINNLTITTTATTTQFALTSGAGHAFFLQLSSTGTVNGVLATGFQFTASQSYSGVMCGAGSNITFVNCQVGTSTTPLILASTNINNSGAFCGGTSGGSGFTGSFTNCIVYPDMSFLAGGSSNGGFISRNNGTVTFNNCKVAGGTLYQSSAGGFVGRGEAKLVFNNCYSLISQDASALDCSAFVGTVPTSQKIYFNNCYQIGTVATGGAAFCNTTSGSGTTIYNYYYNTASTSTRILDAGSATYVNNQLVVQNYNNLLTQTGFNGSVNAIAVCNSVLYAGGSFTSVNGNASIQYLAQWNTATSSWTSVGGGAINGTVNDFWVAGTEIYIVGNFTAPTTARITRWDGSTFKTNVCTDTIDGEVLTIYVANSSNVFVGGSFSAKNGGTNNLQRIGKFSVGSSISEVDGGVSTTVRSIISATTTPGTAIYAGGNFTNANSTSGTVICNRIAYYNGTRWFAMGSATVSNVGLNGSVLTLALSSTGSTLYIGGSFTTDNRATPTTLNYVARWSTSALTNQFLPFGSGTVGVNNTVFNIMEYNSDVYMVGDFTTSGGLDIKYMAVYDFTPATGTSNWSSTAGYLNNNPKTMFISGTTLYIGGDFTLLEDFDGTDEITNLNRFAQIPLSFNKTNYSATGQPSSTTTPISRFNTYFTS